MMYSHLLKRVVVMLALALINLLSEVRLLFINQVGMVSGVLRVS